MISTLSMPHQSQYINRLLHSRLRKLWYNPQSCIGNKQRVTSTDSAVKHHRDNQQWLSDLKGINGKSEQETAYFDLGRYAASCAYNLLRLRAADYASLAKLNEATLADHAMDFAQATLEKILADDSALLSKFRGEAAFTSWIAKITNNIVLSELRKASYRSEIHVEAEDEDGESSDDDPRDTVRVLLLGPDAREPEADAVRRELARAIAACIKQLPEREQIAYWEKEVNGRSGRSIADQLEATRNAVYILLHTARSRLRTCLEARGYG